MTLTPNRRMAVMAVLILAADQLSKLAVLRFFLYAEQREVFPGFLRFVHWGNTGAAWSLFHGNNELLAIVSLLALLALFTFRHHFDIRTRLGQTALGLMFGGISGNLVDRMMNTRRHVVDFVYFYVERRSGEEIGFPAFNVADSAICIGVALLFLQSFRESDRPAPESTGATKA
jgi:signal peptidase II